MFRNGIRQITVGHKYTGHGSGMQQVASPLFDHARQYGTYSVDMGHDVDLPLILPNRQIRIEDLPAGIDARVIKKNVDRAVSLLCRID